MESDNILTARNIIKQYKIEKQLKIQKIVQNKDKKKYRESNYNKILQLFYNKIKIVNETGNTECWMKSPDSTALVPNDGLYTYLSSQGPIKMKLSDQAALNGPPVDGVKGSPEKMFMWANNVASPLCCPSTFSTSTGCVCSTKNQRDFVAGRGDLINSAKDEV